MAAQVVGVIAGVAVCRMLAHTVAGWLGEPADTANVVVANVAVFAVVYLACFFLGRLMHSLLRTLHLSIVNRLAGALFCALEVALVFSLAMNLWAVVLPGSAPATADTGGMRGLVFDLAPKLLNYFQAIAA